MRTLLDRIQGIVNESPDIPAFVGNGVHVSYGEHWDASRRWAGAINLDDHPDQVVGVLMERGPALFAAHLSAWMSGAAYLPLDPTLPAGRLATIIREAECEVVISTDDLAHRLPSTVRVTTTPADLPAATSLPALEDAAYVIYTSGSSGVPKGVEVTHRNLATLSQWYEGAYGLGPDVRASAFSNVAFDCLVIDVWPNLAAGGTVAIPDQAVLESPHAMAEFLDRFDVSHAQMPTVMFERFLASGARTSRVNTIETGAEQLRSWPPADYPAAVFNGYGPTETTVEVTVTGDLRTYEQTGLPPIGKPLPCADVRLIDEHGREVVEPGAPGELVVAGDMVSRGYRNRPDLTNTAFESGSPRRYRTGDLCQWNTNGELEYLGRIDDQVQLTGYRVEPGEIEQCIMEVESVRLAVVVAASDEDDRLTLFAYVEGDEASREAIEAHLVKALPAYMVPEHLHFVDELPLTPNGKVDRAGAHAKRAPVHGGN